MANYHNFNATHNCLSGCVQDYHVSPLRGSSEDPGRGGIDVENYAPLVALQIGESDALVTVGNKSYPPYNTAVIKSIDFGWIDEPKGTCEILDEKGGTFSIFLDALQKCASRVGVGTIIKYKVGWVYVGCDDKKGDKIESIWLEGVLLKIDVNYGPIMKYRLEFATKAPMCFDHRHPQTFGEETPGKDMKLEDAIVELCKEPPEIKVKFAWYDESGNLQFGNHTWEDGGLKGPRACWKGDRQNKYSTISRWIQGYKIKDAKGGKGAILTQDPKYSDTLLVLKDPQPNSKEVIREGPFHLGTYIVNGGKCSNVIEFNPQFGFINAFSNFSSGGGTSGGVKSSNINIEDYKDPEAEGKSCCNSKDAGVQQQATITTENLYTYGDNAPEKVNDARLAHIKANLMTNSTPIEADLKIIGDPRYKFFEVVAGRRVSIVVINPNHLQGGDENNCGDWLKKSDCNVYLSNKVWLVKGINHSVQDGSYVTTLKVYLAAPAVKTGTQDNLGANASGKPLKNIC